MDFLGEHLYLFSGSAQLLAYLALAAVCLVRLGRPWAVVGLLGALASLVSTGWFFTASVVIRLSDGGLDAARLFYAPPAQVAMQLLGVAGTVLVVVAVLLGRRAPKPEEPAGPTGTTFRQLPSGIRWE